MKRARGAEPSRLLDPTSRLLDRKTLRIAMSMDEPSRVQIWADEITRRHGIDPGSEEWRDVLEYKRGDVVLQEIAWCSLHAKHALHALQSIPQAHRAAAVRACINMFQAGKRHEVFHAQQKYARSVAHSHGSRAALPNAIRASADKRRRMTDSELRAGMSRHLTNEQIARKHGISRQAVANRKAKLKKMQT